MLEAVKDKIIVEVLKRAQTTGGIIAPTASVIDPQGYGTVLSVGPDVSEVKVGWILVFHLNGGMDMLMDNRMLKCLKDDEVYGKLTDEGIIKSLKTQQLVSAEGTIDQAQATGIINLVK